jgi:hypothetical protein
MTRHISPAQFGCTDKITELDEGTLGLESPAGSYAINRPALARVATEGGAYRSARYLRDTSDCASNLLWQMRLVCTSQCTDQDLCTKSARFGKDYARVLHMTQWHWDFARAYDTHDRTTDLARKSGSKVSRQAQASSQRPHYSSK